jgi:hypothetical protein
MLKLLCLAWPLAMLGCSSGEDCRPAVLGQVDDARSCVLPAAEVVGLQLCHPAGAVRTLGIRPICVSDAIGQKFLGYIGTDEHISGSGFVTRNDCDAAPSLGGNGGCSP